MSLTISSPAFNGTAFGQYANYSIDVNYTDGFTGKDIYFVMGGFVNPGDPKPVYNEIPEFAYFNTGAAAIYSPTSSLHPTQQIPAPEHTVIGPNDITISGRFLMQADRNNVFNSAQLNNATIQLKNSVENPSVLSNSFPSVYNSGKVLRLIVLVDNGCGIVDTVCEDIAVSARFCGLGLLGGVSEYDFTFSLERNGVTVTDFSQFDPTKIIITVDTKGNTLSTSPELLIYRESNVTNNLDFETDTDALYFAGSVSQTIDHTLVSFQNYTLVSGNIYEAIYELDPSYFKQDSNYRIIPLVKDSGGFYNSGCTNFALRSTGIPLPTTGTMSGVITDYNDEYLNDCLLVTIGERVKSCVTVDKASYNAELIPKLLGVDFDTNFQSVQIIITAGLLGEQINFTGGKGPVEGYEELDNPADFTSCYEFRIPEEWQQQVIGIKHVYTYNVVDPLGNIFQDKITYSQILQVKELDNTIAAPIITGVVFKDDLGNEIEELCDDYLAPITVEVTKNVTANPHDFIAVLVEDNTEFYNEEESYDDNLIDQSDSIILDNVSVGFTADVATFEIDPTLLNPDTKYNVFAIAKEQTGVATECPVINVNADLLVTLVVPGGNQNTVDFDVNLLVTNYTGVVTNFDVIYEPGTPEESTHNFLADNGVFSETVVIRVPPKLITMEISVTLDNGCTYTAHNLQVNVMPFFGFTYSNDIDINPDA